MESKMAEAGEAMEETGEAKKAAREAWEEEKKRTLGKE